MIADAAQRAAALDPARSVIVEAPAGSGKTELLTQRYLRLLALVDEPEQIVAITFTRKAAAEMRQRVVETLKAAAAAAAVVAEHRRPALELARSALARADARGWSLLQQTQRLSILTIDALTASLARQLPVLASGIVSLEVTDDAAGLYRLAARRTAEGLAEDNAAGAGLRTLLAAAGNSLALLEDWLEAVPPERDRWLRLFQQAGGRNLDQLVGENLEQLRRIQLERLRARAGSGLEARLAAALERRQAHRDAQDADSAAGHCAGDGGPAARAAALWREAGSMLLTTAGSWRRRLTRRDGVPASDQALRDEIFGLIAELEALPGLREALAALAALPDAAAPDADFGRLLAALRPVVKRLLAELRVVFAETGTVDHTEVALTALEALGAVDAPSELLLALDRRIEHILVDEFQDTSHLQWALLEKLTAGWEAGDGRSLFIVGDPMQSIYRFRDADLSLFQRAARTGIGEIRLEPVRLAVNFRSAPELVDWANAAFARIFAGAGNGEAGAPPFRPATAGRRPEPGAGVEIHRLVDASLADEIARVVAVAEREVESRPEASVGILVRSRAHLIGMRSALAAAGLPAHAVEIDSLTDTQLGLDLISLSAALLHEGDRLAWLALLRSPCCGIGWADLLRLVGDDADASIWSLLAAPEALARLSADGRRRAEWLRERLERGRSLRPFLSVGRWLRACWLTIDGPASLAGAAELEVADGFFRDLDLLARGGDSDDPARLWQAFARPGGAETPADSGIEIMTIHRAKGLEFDTIILPSLSRIPRGNTYKLIVLKELQMEHSPRISLLAAPGRSASGQFGADLFAYLTAAERGQEAAERVRLLYVAATRARSRLHLIGACPGDDRAPRRGSLLETLWPGIEHDWRAASGDRPVGAAAERDAERGSEHGSERGFERDAEQDAERDAEREAEDGAEPATLVQLPLRRLRFEPDIPLPGPEVEPGPAGLAVRPEFEWVQPASVQVGTLIHRELQRWADLAARERRLSPPRIAPARYRRELALLGVAPEDLAAAAARVASGLEQVFADPTGRWLLEPRAEAWSELRLSLCTADRIEHLRLDRSFVTEQGERWIIDYKTGRHLGAAVDEFLESELKRYQPQLASYARAVAAIDPRPLRVALYFPLMSRLQEWEPTATARADRPA